jgi:hypothetical protein
MSESAPKMTAEAKAYRADMKQTRKEEMLESVNDLVDGHFDDLQVTKNNRLQVKAGVHSLDGEGNSVNIGGRFARANELEDIAAYEDQIRLGMKAKELAEHAPAVKAALDYARAEVDRMNETSNTTSTLKEVGVIRHALVESKALSALEVGNMSNEDIQTLYEYMQISNESSDSVEEHGSRGNEAPEFLFAVGQSVRVMRNAGSFEDGWYVSKQLAGYTQEDGSYYIVAKDMPDGSTLEKTVPDSKLKLWNERSSQAAPDLTPPDAPADDAVAEHELTPPEAPANDAIVEPRVIHLKDIVRSPLAYLSSRMASAAMARREKAETTGDTNEKSRLRRWAPRVLGVAAVAGVAYLSTRGHDTSHLHDAAAGNSFDTPLQDITLPGAGGSSGSREGARSAIQQVAEQTHHFTKEAHTITGGEGWAHQLREMGVSEKQLPRVLEKLQKSHDPAVREWVYTMKDGQPGIAKPGKMPEAVLQSIYKMR